MPTEPPTAPIDVLSIGIPDVEAKPTQQFSHGLSPLLFAPGRFQPLALFLDLPQFLHLQKLFLTL